MTRILIADDHPAFRVGLALMLADVEDIEVVGQAETGSQAVELTQQVAPDVVVMDLRMPEVDGIEATRRIRQLAPSAAVIVLTMFEDDDSVFAAMRAGALGYLLKGAEQDEIVRAIRAVAAGEAIFGPEVAKRVIAHFADGSGSARSAFPSLTDRERQILEQGQRDHRPRPGAQPQDRPQPRVEHLREAAGVRPVSGNREGARRRVRCPAPVAVSPSARRAPGSGAAVQGAVVWVRARLRFRRRTAAHPRR